MAIGAVSCGTLVDRFGPRRTSMVTSTLMIAAVSLQCFAVNRIMLLFGKVSLPVPRVTNLPPAPRGYPHGHLHRLGEQLHLRVGQHEAPCAALVTYSLLHQYWMYVTPLCVDAF